MRLRLDKPWLPLDEPTLAQVPGQLGVYEIAGEDGEIVRIAYAGGDSTFGLRSELASELERLAPQRMRFRYEVNMQYMSRYQELLMLYRADQGRLPRDNDEDPGSLGRLRPNRG